MKTRDKYLVENKAEQANYFLNSVVANIRDYRRALEAEMGFVNHTVLANEVGNLILSALNKALTKKEADFVKKVLKTGKPLMTYGKGSKK